MNFSLDRLLLSKQITCLNIIYFGKLETFFFKCMFHGFNEFMKGRVIEIGFVKKSFQREVY